MQVDTENRQQGNPFRTRHKPSVSVDAAVLASVQTIPGLGGVKAKCLLERFKSMCSRRTSHSVPIKGLKLF